MRLVALLLVCPYAQRCPRGRRWTSASARRTSPRPPRMGGKVYQYSLADALKKGPVVLYFFPAAYSEGCSVEAHYFAEAIPQFQALGATVVGVSGDDIDTLSKFSVQACQSKFPVASDEKQSGDEVLRRGAQDAPGIRQSHLVRDRARRLRRVPLHEPQSRPSTWRRCWARCAAGGAMAPAPQVSTEMHARDGPARAAHAPRARRTLPIRAAGAGAGAGARARVRRLPHRSARRRRRIAGREDRR